MELTLFLCHTPDGTQEVVDEQLMPASLQPPIAVTTFMFCCFGTKFPTLKSWDEGSGQPSSRQRSSLVTSQDRSEDFLLARNDGSSLIRNPH